MPSEITLPPPALSFKKVSHSYLASLITPSTYELRKDNKLDVSNVAFHQMNINTGDSTPKTKEPKPYTFKQLFASLRLFTNSTEKLSSEEKLLDEFEKEDGPLENDMLQLALNVDLLEHQPSYSPVKSAYILSLEKLRSCKERPMVQVLLIHQTMTKLQCSVTVNGLHPSLVECRVLEKAAFLKRVGKATCSQVVPAPIAIASKQQHIPPPPPYSRFENIEVNRFGDIEDNNDDDDDDDDVPLGLLQTYLHSRSQLNITL